MKIFAISIHIIHNYCKKDIFSSKMRKTEITHKNRKLMKIANIFLSNNKKTCHFAMLSVIAHINKQKTQTHVWPHYP